jgi:CRISPR-associated protein Csx14
MKKTGYREIFLFITGATPQVITETIYCLAQKSPPVHPDELYIITTSKGKEAARKTLIEKGILKSLCREYSLPEISIREDSFVIPKDLTGKPLEDIRDESDNELMGDLITAFIREKTADLSTRLHCSLAGGRKTMSFYMGAAMQLFARPWDKLYHVLVSPEFESNPEFFYKPKNNKVIKAGNKRLNSKDAEIMLAELPFIRLRSKLSLQSAGFKELVKEGQREIDIAMIQPELRVKLSESTIYVGEKSIKLTPTHLMTYVAYLRQKQFQCKHPRRPYCGDCTDCFSPVMDFSTRPALEEMAKDYRRIYSHQPMKAEELLKRHKNGFLMETIRQYIAKIKRTIEEALNDKTLASYYVITPLRRYGNTCYGVRVEKTKITIEE